MWDSRKGVLRQGQQVPGPQGQSWALEKGIFIQAPGIWQSWEQLARGFKLSGHSSLGPSMVRAFGGSGQE